MLCDKCSHLNWQRLKVCKPVVHDFQKVDSGLIDKAKRPFKNAAKILKRITLDSSARDKLSKGCKHHRSTIAVRQAADAGCDLCKLLVDAPTFTAVPTNSPVFYQFQTVEGALSRWSTRNTGYTNVEFCVADTTDNKRMKKFTILNVAALPGTSPFGLFSTAMPLNFNRLPCRKIWDHTRSSTSFRSTVRVMRI
jgi:hypothetical protein